MTDADDFIEFLIEDGQPVRAAQLRRLVARVRELETGLTWTDDKPTVPGWYWWRRSPDCAAEVIEVDIGVQLFAAISGGCTPVTDLFGQFAGPIPQPEEPR